MASASEIGKKRTIVKTIVFGALSATLYALFFVNASELMPYYTKGLYYAALPIATAFLFSFVHGTFASNIWVLLGIEAAKKRPAPRPTAVTQPTAGKRPRPRVYLNT